MKLKIGKEWFFVKPLVNQAVYVLSNRKREKSYMSLVVFLSIYRLVKH